MPVRAIDSVLISDFDYDLPAGAIAQEPLPERDASRLLVLDRASGAVQHRLFRDLPDLLSPGDLVVFNRPSAKTHSGIWRDLFVRQRRTEVDVQIKPIADIGARHGIATPTITKLVALIHEIEDGKRAMSDDNLLELIAQ